MKSPEPAPDYGYSNAESAHHHTYLLAPLLELIQANSAPHKGYRILDLGCGNGSLTHTIAQQGYDIVGVEASTQGMAIACQNFPECRFIQARIEDLPTPELQNAFDLVISVEVIEHLLYPRELLRVAKHCLKPGGTLILTTPYHGYLKNLLLAISGKMDQHFTALWDGGHVKFFSVASISKLLKEERFTNLHFKFAGRLPYLWKSMLCAGFLCSSIGECDSIGERAVTDDKHLTI